MQVGRNHAEMAAHKQMETKQPKHWLRFVSDFVRAEDGASLIIITVLFMALLGFAALAVDASYVYYNNQRMQIAADAAALAGARLIAHNAVEGDVHDEIHQLAFANGADSVEWTYFNSERGVHVTTSCTLESFFAGIFGYESFTVQAEAKAQVEAVLATGNLMPFTVVCMPWDGENNAPNAKDYEIKCGDGPGFEYGVTYTLHEPTSKAPGNVGWLRWPGDRPSATDLEDNIRHPELSPTVRIGDWVDATTGVKSSVFPEFERWLGKPVVIPIFDKVTGDGANVKYRVHAFAMFEITSYDKQDKTITGKFIRSLAHSDVSNGSGPDYGVSDIRLVQ